MYHSESEANAKGFKAAGNISRKSIAKAQKGFGLFHLMCYAGLVGVASMVLSVVL